MLNKLIIIFNNQKRINMSLQWILALPHYGNYRKQFWITLIKLCCKVVKKTNLLYRI